MGRRSILDVWTIGALGILAVGVCALLWATAPTGSGAGRDFFDSSLYWWTWLVLPAAAAAIVAGLGVSRREAVLVAAVLVAPMMVLAAVHGTVLAEPRDGASLWIVGEVILLAQAGFTAAAAWAASDRRR